MSKIERAARGDQRRGLEEQLQRARAHIKEQKEIEEIYASALRHISGPVAEAALLAVETRKMVTAQIKHMMR